MVRASSRRKLLYAALRDTRGATAVEFALLAIPFFGLIAAILQTSLVFISSQVLESAVIDASRYVRIGEAQKQGTAEYKKQICDRLYGLFGDCQDMHLRVDTIQTFKSTAPTIPVDITCPAECDWTTPETWAPGGASSVVMVQAYFRYPVPIPLGPLSIANLADGTRLIGSTFVFMNEPF
ncbi:MULTISPECIES: TadE/TadG family type IV pilus assembly protein [unclassified Devosia]|uniref:TadE/TadG family type IV pilus assembly protein n=1 Tax=unclassified Devosia TaxID=196773 RepID=UPI00145C7356|nr:MULTISPECIES: TadE/TadG family type IV pilus assembly protein [unclassified Devosia]MBJ6988802.1 pilus assembly protein [Devosia sp. MC521]QMW63064.1 pilus assembly protein [Devosia sp. MC521]